MLGKSTHLQVVPQQSTQTQQTWGYRDTTKTSKPIFCATRAPALAFALLLPVGSFAKVFVVGSITPWFQWHM